MKHSGRVPFWVRLLGLAISFTCESLWAQSTDVCDPAPAVKATLDQLPAYRRDPAQTDWQVYGQRLATLHTLLRQYPNDVFVQRTYISSTTSLRQVDKASLEETRKATAEFKARYEQNPDNAQLDYLYGLTLVGRATPEAIELFDTALQKDPSFVLPHLSLVTIYSSPAFLNQAKSTAHLKAFLDACPATFEGYERLTGTADSDLQKTYAGKLRALLQTRSDAEAVGAYRTLWSIEFKTHPPSEYQALRTQVGRDLDRLRQRNLEDKREWYETLEDGYKLVSDQKQADWAKEQRERRFPSAGELPEETKWFKDHPWPDPDASSSTRRAFYSELLAQTNQWSKEGAKGALSNFSILMDRLEAMNQLDDVPAADVELAVDQMLKFAGENGGDGPWSDDYSSAAETLFNKHLDPQHVVELAQKGLAIQEAQSKEPGSDLYATKENLDDERFYRGYSRFQMLRYEIDGYLRLKQDDKAELLLSPLDQWLQDFKSLVGDNNGRKRTYAFWLVNYWGLRAQEAELRGRRLDAMSFYENALLTRLDAQIKPATDKKDELAENAHRLWVSLDGTESGWQLWYGRRANDLANQLTLTWENANQPLPAFELTDLSAKPWNLALLKGKVTLINFWASWCGPCREELPHLQKLIDHYKDRSDVQFITLNMDDNPGLIQPFLREHELSLTVIPASNYVTETLQVHGIPQNWIVDEHAVVRLKSVGYGPAEQWTTGVENAIDEAKPAAASPSPGGPTQ